MLQNQIIYYQKNSFLFNTKQAQKTYEEESAIKKTFKEKTQVQGNINNTNIKLT